MGKLIELSKESVKYGLMIGFTSVIRFMFERKELELESAREIAIYLFVTYVGLFLTATILVFLLKVGSRILSRGV